MESGIHFIQIEWQDKPQIYEVGVYTEHSPMNIVHDHFTAPDDEFNMGKDVLKQSWITIIITLEMVSL